MAQDNDNNMDDFMAIEPKHSSDSNRYGRDVNNNNHILTTENCEITELLCCKHNFDQSDNKIVPSKFKMKRI